MHGKNKLIWIVLILTIIQFLGEGFFWVSKANGNSNQDYNIIYENIDYDESYNSLKEAFEAQTTTASAIKIKTTNRVLAEDDFRYLKTEIVDKYSVKALDLKDTVTQGNELAWKAFENSDSLEFVSLPLNLERISNSSFSMCDNLEIIKSNGSIKYIGAGAFYECPNLNDISKLFESVVEVGESAFEGCKSIDGEIIFSEQLLKISDVAFKGCIGIDRIYFKNNLKEIGAKAFLNCSSLQGVIEIVESVERLGEDAFSGCVNVEEYILSDKLEVLSKGVFYHNKGLKKITLGSNVKVIDAMAFEGCMNLTEFIIPESIEEIKHHAFINCYSIKNIKFPDKYINVENNAFENMALDLSENSDEYKWFKKYGFDMSIIADGQLPYIRVNAKNIQLERGMSLPENWIYLESIYGNFPQNINFSELANNWNSTKMSMNIKYSILNSGIYSDFDIDNINDLEEGRYSIKCDAEYEVCRNMNGSDICMKKHDIKEFEVQIFDEKFVVKGVDKTIDLGTNIKLEELYRAEYDGTLINKSAIFATADVDVEKLKEGKYNILLKVSYNNMARNVISVLTINKKTISPEEIKPPKEANGTNGHNNENENREDVDSYSNLIENEKNRKITNIHFKVGDFFWYKNRVKQFPKMDVSPIVRNKRVYIPLRYLSKALGINEDCVLWNKSERTVSIVSNEKVFKLYLDNGEVLSNVNSEEVFLVGIPFIYKDRVMVPIGQIVRIFSDKQINVSWDNANKVISILRID